MPSERSRMVWIVTGNLPQSWSRNGRYAGHSRDSFGGQRTAGRRFMDLQFPPFWIKFSNYRHQCPPTWNALAVDAFILVTQPGAFNFKIDLALTNRAVTAITFSPQHLPCSAHLSFDSCHHSLNHHIIVSGIVWNCGRQKVIARKDSVVIYLRGSPGQYAGSRKEPATTPPIYQQVFGGTPATSYAMGSAAGSLINWYSLCSLEQWFENPAARKIPGPFAAWTIANVSRPWFPRLDNQIARATNQSAQTSARHLGSRQPLILPV